MKQNTIYIIAAVMLIAIAMIFAGCTDNRATVSSSGIQKATVTLSAQPNGMTVEQQNVAERLVQDNKPGSIKHLYLISSFNNRVIYYSTVRGKVTSGGKRLSPTSVATDVSGSWSYGIPVNIGGYDYRTAEVTQDDGTYGTSADYLFWWDTKDVYHQLYIGNSIVMITSEPININTGTTIDVAQVKS
jgi:hypothetical protein